MEMIKFLKRVGLATVASLMLFSCASNKMTRDDANRAFVEEDYEAVETYLAAENEDGDKVNYNLDEAMLLAVQDMPKESAQMLLDVYKQMQLLTGEMSVGDMMGAALGSEEAIKYSGPSYEFNMLDAMTGFNFIKLGDIDNARAMMNRFYNDNKELLVKLSSDMAELAAESEKSSTSETTKTVMNVLEVAINLVVTSAGLPPLVPGFLTEVFLYPEELKSAVVDDSYGMSPFEFYLRAVLFANNGDLDEAKRTLEAGKALFAEETGSQIVKLYGDDSDFYDNMVAKFEETVSAIAGSATDGSIQVVTLADTIAQRESASNDRIVWAWPFPYTDKEGNPMLFNLNFHLTWPSVKANDTVVKSVKVTVKDAAGAAVADSVESVLVEDFDNLVKHDAMVKAKGAYVRSVIRNISRKGTAFAPASVAALTAVETVNQAGVNPLTLLALTKAIEGLQYAVDAIDNGEFSDERQCAFFPSKARAAGVVVPAGTYTVTVDYLNAAGEVIKTEDIPNVEVTAGVPSVVASSFINTGNIPLLPVEEEDAE